MAAPIPKKIGKYDVIEVVGRGGMGVVYRAKDPFLDRMVAIKIMTISYADYPDLLQRFYREAKATANLQHPNIVTVYELGEHEGSPYLAMQFLDGASLDTMLRSGQELTLLQKLDIMIQACHGLSYAHQKGIVHRDIKPGNIMVLKDGNVKIVDFGIARIGDTNFTRTGQFMGSLNYMSLEQLNDKLQVDQRTDVYSTGVVLYQVLTGRLPFEADSTGATLMKILNEAPPPFSKFISGFPPEIEAITLKALAKDRDQRYASADELALDLTQLQDRFKTEKISAHMQQAELLLQQNSLFQANDELMAVLKLDKQHTKASAMLRTLRKQIEKEQSVERARQLREQAEEALRREDFDPALGFVEQAMQIDATNADLQQLRAKVQAAKAEIEHLRQVMQRAENAHRAGNLDTAKQAIEEVLSRRPDDTRVKSLYRMIQKELDERMRQKRMEALLESARKEMTNRHYTAAFDLLKEAEKVDPEAPALRSLLETFTSARDQEKRRRDLEQLTRQVEQAINTDDHQSALNLLADGMQRFPAEPVLLKLKDLAESEKQAAQTKSFVREKIAAAREILNAGNATGALKVLQDALKKAPGNPHLESLVSIAQERLAQDRDEQAKSRCIQQANEALGKRSYDEAIRILEAGQVQFTASAEIDNLLRFAREQQAKDAKKQDLENSVRRAQEFLKNQEYDRAIALLESILARTPDEELSTVLEEARRRRNTLNNQIAAAITRGQQFLNEGSPAKAVEFLQAQPTSFRRSDRFRDLVLAAAKQNVPKEPEPLPLAKPDTDLEAPEPAKTMMWNTMDPPEIEPAVVEPPKVEPRKPEPARPPRVPIGRVTPTPPHRPVTQVPTPGFLQRFSQQQKLLAAALVGVVLFIAMVIAMWPSSKSGTLTVRSNVDGAEILVDGKSKGTVSSGREVTIKLDEGHHQVHMQKDGYQPSSRDVDIVKDKDVQLPLDLTPIVVAAGTLSVQTNVDAVDVFVDKDAARVTSGKQLQLTVPVGDHTVRVSKDQYNQLPAQSVHVEKDQAASVDFKLVELTGHPGFLQIVSTPGATVRVDGQSWGTVGQDGKARVQVEPKASFLVEITANNADPWKKTVGPVKADQTLNVTANLILKPVAPKPAPIVDSFTGPTEPVSPGQTVKITWRATNATAVDIDSIGQNLNPTGEKDVTVSQTTTYTAVARGEGGTSSARTLTVTVKVAPPKAPAVSSFSANLQTIKQGDSTTLSWSTTDAQSVTLDGTGVSPSGSKQVSPTKTTTYNLAASGASGTANSSITVTVTVAKPPEPNPPQPPSDLPGIRAALDQLQDAYGSVSLDEMVKIWPSLNTDKKRKKSGLSDLFKSVQALRMKYTQCGDPSVTGEVAKISCTQTMTNTVSGKVQPVQPNKVDITLKKSNGNWLIDDIVGH
jgi:hypothetical protein